MSEAAERLSAAFSTHRGTVSSFDAHIGAGEVADRATAQTWFFHCTMIADGSRSIAEGTDVEFEVAPGPNGLEAVGVRPVPN